MKLYIFNTLLLILSSSAIPLNISLLLLSFLSPMASKSSTPTTSSPRRAVIIDDLPPTLAPVRNRRRGGTLHSLGFMENKNTSSSKGIF